MLILKDKGIGIEKSDLEKVLTPFYRGKNVINVKGSGIGLSLTSKIINLHNGAIEINSKMGVGTQAKLTLPLVLS